MSAILHGLTGLKKLFIFSLFFAGYITYPQLQSPSATFVAFTLCLEQYLASLSACSTDGVVDASYSYSCLIKIPNSL